MCSHEKELAAVVKRSLEFARNVAAELPHRSMCDLVQLPKQINYCSCGINDMLLRQMDYLRAIAIKNNIIL